MKFIQPGRMSSTQYMRMDIVVNQEEEVKEEVKEEEEERQPQ